MTAETMVEQTGIVSPLKNDHTPDLGPLAVMVSSRGDLISCRDVMGLEASASQRIFISRLYLGDNDRGAPFSITGPFIGAPYAVMILETLIAWGAREIIIFGWCGAVSPKVKIGDIVVPSAAIIDEGTSRHYQENKDLTATPSRELSAKIKKILKKEKIDFHEGAIWSTDAIYRETPEKIAHYQQKEVVAVEMEMSALFTVGKYRQVEVVSILVVSDEVSSLRWRPGFKNIGFKKSRKNVTKVIGRLCRSL